MNRDLLKAIIWGIVSAGIIIGTGLLLLRHFLPDRSQDPLSKRPLSFFEDGTRAYRSSLTDELDRRYIPVRAAPSLVS